MEDFQEKWDGIGYFLEIISLTNVRRENWGHPGERQKPDGDDTIATQVGNG